LRRGQVQRDRCRIELKDLPVYIRHLIQAKLVRRPEWQFKVERISVGELMVARKAQRPGFGVKPIREEPPDRADSPAGILPRLEPRDVVSGLLELECRRQSCKAPAQHDDIQRGALQLEAASLSSD